MKTSPIAILAFLAIHLAASAAPRLVVSTPSLTPESKIDLVLDLPAVAPSELGKSVDNTWLEIKPALPGKLVWKAQNIANFIPENPPAIATRYTFSLSKGHTHTDGSAIPAGKITTLDSEPFRIYLANAQNRWSEDYSPSTSEWLIVFNDDVDPATAAAFVSFSSKSGQRVAARLERPTVARAGYYANAYKSWSARNPNQPATEPTQESQVPNILIATPASPLPVGKDWVISTLKGLPNLGANARLADDNSYQIGDVTPFEVAKIASYVAANEPRRILLNFNQPVAAKLPDDFLTASLAISPRPENLSAEIDGRQIQISGNFSVADKYTVTIRPPLTSKSGLVLTTPTTEEIQFERLDPGLALPSENQAQLANGKRIYQIQTVNLASLHIRVKKLAGIDLIRAYQGYQHYTGIGRDGHPIAPTAPLPSPLVVGETILIKDIPLGNPIDTSKEVTLLWDELLPKDLHHGTLFIDVTGTPHPEADTNSRRSAQAMLQLTDIGLAWKLTPGEAFIYAFSCDTGAPLPGVKLQFYGEDAKTLDSATTDAAGLATLPRADTIRHLHASLESDTYLTAFDATLPTVGTWHFPVRFSWNKSGAITRRALLFTDRSLYRPGETVRLKGIVRSQNGNAIEPAVSSPAQLVILDPTDKAIHTSPVTFSPNGSFDLTYKLPLSKTGSHTIRLEYPDDLAKAAAIEDDWQTQEIIQQGARFTLPLRVEEFRRNAFEIQQTIAPAEPAATRISADLTATYYQGQPVAAGKITYFSRVSAQNPYPARFRDYLFGNHRRDDSSYWYHYFGYRWDDDSDSHGQTSQVQGEAVLSADGKATLTVEIPQAEFPTAREVTLSAEVTDANNQTLTSTASTTVHPASVYIGVSRNDRLIRAGEAVPLKLVATDTEGEPFKGAVKLTATLTREINAAVKTRNDAGDTTTRNDVTVETVSTSEITIEPTASAGQGTDFIVTPKSTGRHYLTLRGNDPEGRAFATVTYFNAYGTNDYPWLYEDGLRVKLVAEKKSYQPGETARVLVLSPIEGTALVTIEREKVLRSFQVQLKADNPVIEIPLNADDAPNAFVSVLIVKGAKDSAREHKEPQLRLGYCELIVENLRDTLAIDLSASADSTYRPGDEVTLTGSIKLADGSPAANAEVTLYAEDEGTLAVMGYETPRPMDYFYKPRMLDVESGSSFETFISEDPESQNFFNKGFFIGGGGGEMEKIVDLLRKNFDPCATWAPALITDAAGKFSHSFTVPDTLTRYRVIAVAHHEAARFGHHESAITVKKDLMLEPKTPRFANQSDTFDSQVLVQNASEFTGTWEISFSTQTGPETPAATPQGPTRQTVTLDPGKSTTVVFPTLAETTGEAVLTWKATPVSIANGNLTPQLTRRLSDAVETRFQVHYPMPLLRQSKLVKLETPGAKQNMRDSIDALLLDGSGTVDLEFARSPLIEAGGSIDFLLSYPHGCVEQTTSALIPWLAIGPLKPVVPAFAKIPDAKVQDAIQGGADRLLSMQLPDGSFSYWPGNTETVSWTTSYAGMALIMAAENGANVPPSAIDSLKNHLIQSLRGIAEETSATALEMHARTLFVLSLSGSAQPAYINLLRDRPADLTPNARALLATAMCTGELENDANQAAARDLLYSKVPFKLKNDEWMPWTPDQAYQMIAWTAADPTGTAATRALDRMLNDRSPYGHWRTTWVNGWSLLAMATYADSQDPTDESLAINLETRDGVETINLSSEQPTATRSFRLSPDLKLDLTSNLAAYVRLKVAAKPKLAPMQPVATNGLSVDRIYERMNPDGTSEFLNQPKVGDLIRVSLRVTLPKDDTRYLVIEDALPSIFETVNSDFKSQASAAGVHTSENDWNISHSELRTDRAVFYLDQVWRKGTYTVTYLARCTVPGSATAPPAKVESMYDPENFALSASRTFTTK
jgi:uncharacterized protein YfaS (alpha-2-macroglobulin family)